VIANRQGIERICSFVFFLDPLRKRVTLHKEGRDLKRERRQYGNRGRI
jgi:hypothetical protein